MCQTIPVAIGHFYALEVLGKPNSEFPGLGAAVLSLNPKCSDWLSALRFLVPAIGSFFSP